MAGKETTAGGPTSTSETQAWERRNTDPTIPFDGALPENIPGPASNVEAEIAAGKRAAAYGELSTRLRPEHAKQRAESGDAVTDSDVNAAPSAGLTVAEDSGAKERAEASADGAEPDGSGRDVRPQGRATRQDKQTRA
jgi:hypothetical protein